MSAGARQPVPSMPRWLGFAGLAPQIAAVALVLSGDLEWRFTALALGYAYAALILSFLGGLWWGLAARSAEPAPAWLWIVAVAPSLVALASAIPWAVGAEWPRPSLALLGFALILALAVDYRLRRDGLAPYWWLGLRIPLSLGLGLLTLALSVV